MKVLPRCRFCQVQVDYFGEVCKDCEGADDSLLRLARDDADRLRPDREDDL